MIINAAAHVVEAGLRLRAGFGGADVLRQRLVLVDPPAPATIWLHGASVGELVSARATIGMLAQESPLLVTANSLNGRDIVQSWNYPARLAPLDVPGALRRFLDAARPNLAITVEGEFWPLRAGALDARGVPHAMIGARISARSAARWGRLPGVIGSVLSRIAVLSAQDADSEARLLRLGLREAALMPRLNLKLLGPASITPPDDNPQRDRVLLAASTHEGEEEVVLDAWLKARERFPDLRLILALRHPRRADEVAEQIRARGLEVLRRSEGADDGPVLLADTLGEMDRWYRRAGICFVGGSYADRGGHTPWEPAAYRCAILHGPNVSNHAEAYRALQGVGAARSLSADELAQGITQLLCDPALARQMGHSARELLSQQAGDPKPLVARLHDLAVRGIRSNIG